MKPALRNILVLLAAVLAAAAVWTLLSSSRTPQQTPPPVHMLTAASNLPAGLLLRESEFKWQAVPANAVPKDAIIQETPAVKSLPGSLLKNPIGVDQPILSSSIMSPNAPGFLSATLRPGMRAVSVAINDVSGNAGLIQPGDYVDLLLTQTLHNTTQSSSHSLASETIASSLRVIAVGSMFQRPKESDLSTPNPQARTVTLEVAPRTAEIVTLAAHLGDLSMSLRSFAVEQPDNQAGAGLDQQQMDLDSSAPSKGPVWAGDVSEATSSTDKPTSDLGSVQVLRGSTNA